MRLPEGDDLFSKTAEWIRKTAAACTDGERQKILIPELLAAYLIAWTLYAVIGKSSQDLHFDMTELIAWSRNLAVGFDKHPPLAAMLVAAWFSIFPVADWSYYLLAVLIPTTTLWIAWVLYADYLDPAKRLIAVALLTFIPFFNFQALKFNVNTVQMPFWALTIWLFLRSYKDRSSYYAALTGIAAALCVLTKYWSVFLLASIALGAVVDPRRGAYFRSRAPWITAVTAAVVLSPHVVWLVHHDFPPLRYAMAIHGGAPLGEVLGDDLYYLLGAMAYACIPLAILLLGLRLRAKEILDVVWPPDSNRRMIAVIFWGALLLPLGFALVSRANLHAVWLFPNFVLLPLVFLSSGYVEYSRRALHMIFGFAVIWPLGMVLASPVIAFFVHTRGLEPEQTQIKMLAAEVEKNWRAVTSKPLHYVDGDAYFAWGVAAYSHDRPQALPGLPRPPKGVLQADGFAVVCHDSAKVDCDAQFLADATDKARAAAFETDLSRSFLGVAGPSQHYLIYIVRPLG